MTLFGFHVHTTTWRCIYYYVEQMNKQMRKVVHLNSFFPTSLWQFNFTRNLKLCAPELPDALHLNVLIRKSKELAARVLCAGSLTLLIVCCEKRPVVCPKEVHILIHLRQTRLWETGIESKAEHDHAWLINYWSSWWFKMVKRLLRSGLQGLREYPEVTPSSGVRTLGSPVVVDLR